MTRMRPTRLLQQPRRRRRALIAGLLTPPALALFASQAMGDSISMVQNDPTATVGQAVNFTASGDITSSDMFGFDVYLFVKDPDLDPTCASDLQTEEATTMASAGNEAWVSPSTGFYVGSSGAFSVPYKFTFTGPGPFLFCGYLESDFSTVASGQLSGIATAAGPAPSPTPPAPAPTKPTAPAVVHGPRITRTSHSLICHAGTWSNSPTSVGYRWYLRGRARSIGSHRALVERRPLRGRRVRCRVTARNAGGARTASTRWVRVP